MTDLNKDSVTLTMVSDSYTLLGLESDMVHGTNSWGCIGLSQGMNGGVKVFFKVEHHHKPRAESCFSTHGAASHVFPTFGR